MLACLIAVAFQKTPITMSAFGSWNGKSWAGLSVGTTEVDLGKQAPISKTVNPDPASIRIAVDKKGWIVTGVLTDVNKKGSLAGFELEVEKDEPIESLELLQQELGPADFTAYPRVRYSDWSLAVWKDKGIAAVLRGTNRPLVQKILLTTPDALNQNLDLWPRDSNEVRDFPRVPVTGFQVSTSVDPRDSSIETVCDSTVRRHGRRLMDSYSGQGWVPSRDGARVQVSTQIRKRSTISIDLSVSISYKDELGDISLTSSSSDSTKKDVEIGYRTDQLFDDQMAKLAKMIDDKYKQLSRQAEWRPFTALARPKL